MMKIKLPVCLTILDLILYVFLFRSGVILPIFDPPKARQPFDEKTLPRDTPQKLLWTLVHAPTSDVIFEHFGNEKYECLSVIQTALIGFAIGWFVDHKRGVKTSLRYSLREAFLLVTIISLFCFLFYLAFK